MTRNIQVHFRANQNELAHIKKLAKESGLSQSEYLRLTALGLGFTTSVIQTASQGVNKAPQGTQEA